MVAVETSAKNVRFDYEFSPVNELVVNNVEDSETGKPKVESIEVNGEQHAPSQRFFTSLFARFQFNKAFFKYFTHDEVFARIAERDNGDRLRVCVERSEDKNGKPQSRLLAVTNPARPIVAYDELIEKLGRYNGESVTYANGIVESQHSPRAGANGFNVGGDEHANRFLMSCPVDGYGLPSTYLALIRQVCENGMVAMSKAFRSTIALGQGDDDIGFALTRVLDQFNNEEGFAALRQRLEAATRSWSSVNETNMLYKMLAGMHSTKMVNAGDGSALAASPTIRKSLTAYQGVREGEKDKPLGGRLMTAFHGMTGDTTQIYGLANLDALSVKRQRTLPVKCTVYDMINFATEVATHYADPDGTRRLNGFVGTLITNEYDMEGTKDSMGEFADFHVNAKLASGMTGSEHAVNN